jgi:hypothetical protein
MPKKKKLITVVDGSDFARVYLKYGLERLVEEGHYSVEDIPLLDNCGEYTKNLLGDKAFKARLEKAESKSK